MLEAFLKGVLLKPELRKQGPPVIDMVQKGFEYVVTVPDTSRDDSLTEPYTISHQPLYGWVLLNPRNKIAVPLLLDLYPNRKLSLRFYPIAGILSGKNNNVCLPDLMEQGDNILHLLPSSKHIEEVPPFARRKNVRRPDLHVLATKIASSSSSNELTLEPISHADHKLILTTDDTDDNVMTFSDKGHFIQRGGVITDLVHDHSIALPQDNRPLVLVRRETGLFWTIRPRKEDQIVAQAIPYWEVKAHNSRRLFLIQPSTKESLTLEKPRIVNMHTIDQIMFLPKDKLLTVTRDVGSIALLLNSKAEKNRFIVVTQESETEPVIIKSEDHTITLRQGESVIIGRRTKDKKKTLPATHRLDLEDDSLQPDQIKIVNIGGKLIFVPTNPLSNGYTYIDRLDKMKQKYQELAGFFESAVNIEPEVEDKPLPPTLNISTRLPKNLLDKMQRMLSAGEHAFQQGMNSLNNRMEVQELEAQRIMDLMLDWRLQEAKKLGITDEKYEELLGWVTPIIPDLPPKVQSAIEKDAIKKAKKQRHFCHFVGQDVLFFHYDKTWIKTVRILNSAKLFSEMFKEGVALFEEKYKAEGDYQKSLWDKKLEARNLTFFSLLFTKYQNNQDYKALIKEFDLTIDPREQYPFLDYPFQ